MLHSTNSYNDDQRAMYLNHRKSSASEPLLPETIQFIKDSLKSSSYHPELPHVFVVFGASVSVYHIVFFSF